jgi:hypothetical protein
MDKNKIVFDKMNFVHLNNITCTFNSIFKKEQQIDGESIENLQCLKKKTGKRPILKKKLFHASLIRNGINRVQPTRTPPNPIGSYIHPA